MVRARHSGISPDGRWVDDPRLPIGVGVAVMLSSALWGWSFMVVAGVGLAVTAVGVIGWRHHAKGLQRWALWLSIVALAASLLARASLISWQDVASQEVSWIVAGEAGIDARAAVGQKRVELHLRSHPGYVHTVYSTPLATALKGAPATLPARFSVARTIWGVTGVRALALGPHDLCTTTRCPPQAVPTVGGGGGWRDGAAGSSPW